jgi:TP901 family phage tail tape measure protein
VADRVIRVRLQAEINSYLANMKQAATAAQDFGRQLTSGSKAGDQVLGDLGRTAGIAGLAIGTGLGLAARAAMGFDQEMSNLAATSGATADEMDRLRQSALDAGAATTFSASEAAQAQVELAKAGISTSDILSGALAGSLDLAAAGNLNLAQAAEIAAAAMTTFDLAGSDVDRIADALAAGANKSAANVDDMALALQQSGLVADQLGLSLEETVGILALFAQNGLRGSDAGTSFKTMLQRLTPQSAEAREEMERLGIEMFNASGEFIGIDAAAEELRTSLIGLTEEQRASALAVLYGSDAVRAATILMENGAAGVSDWTLAVTDAGYAADLAREKTDNLAGDLEQLGGAFETSLIAGGSKATDTLRGLVQAATDVVGGFAAMPDQLQTVGVGLAGISATGLTLIGAFGTLYPRLQETKKALESLGSGGQFVSRNLGAMTSGLAVAGVAVAAVSYLYGKQAEKQAEAKRVVDEYTQAILDQNGALNDNIDAVTARELGQSSFAGELREQGANFDVLLEGVRSYRGELSLLSSEFNVGQNNLEFADELAASGIAASEFGGELGRLYEAMGGRSSGTFDDFLSKLADLSGNYETATSQAANMDAATAGLDESARSAALGIAGIGPAIEETLTPAEEAKEAYEKAEQAVQDYADRVRSVSDPLFGLVSAQRRTTDAQGDITRAEQSVIDAAEDLAAARANPEATAREIRDAEQRVADAYEAVADAQLSAIEAAADLESAQIDVAGQLELGTTSLDAMEQALHRWVTAGSITEDQARAIYDELVGVTTQADLLQGRQVAFEVHAATDLAESNLAALDNHLLRLAEGITLPIGIDLSNVAGLDNRFFNLPGNAAGGWAGSGVRGAGDSILSWHDPREFILQPSATAQFTDAELYGMNQGLRPAGDGQAAAFAAGMGSGGFQVNIEKVVGADTAGQVARGARRVYMAYRQ